MTATSRLEDEEPQQLRTVAVSASDPATQLPSGVVPRLACVLVLSGRTVGGPSAGEASTALGGASAASPPAPPLLGLSIAGGTKSLHRRILPSWRWIGAGAQGILGLTWRRLDLQSRTWMLPGLS